MRTTKDGCVFHLFTNAGSKPVTARARIEGAGLEEWNSITGKVSVAAVRSNASSQIEFNLDLPPAGSRLFLVSRDAAVAKTVPASTPGKGRELPLQEWKVTRASQNVLVLDYCDLRLAGRTYEDINTWDANWKIWQAHGFERPAWDNAVQFRRRVLDLPPFPADSGFEATFHFTVADAAALKGAELALELPELYKVTLNGSPVDFAPAERWLDNHIKSIGAEPLLKLGENIVRVTGTPFDVHMELENIYIRGNFAAQAEERGFSLRTPQPLELGSWQKQGLPFYYDSVLYEARVDVPRGTRTLRASFPNWQGSVAEVLFDGKRVETVGWQPYVCEMPAAPGAHTVALRVVSTPRNLFGPFHNPTKPRMIAWPGAWSEFPEHQPPGAKYDLVDYGLMERFRVEAIR